MKIKYLLGYIYWVILLGYIHIQIIRFDKLRMPHVFKFQTEHSLQTRIGESQRISDKYPDRVPIICEFASQGSDLNLDKNKYLVPLDLTLGQFLFVIRKRLNNTGKLSEATAIFMFVNDIIPQHTEKLSDIYKKYKNPDGFLYIYATLESTFGV